MQLLYTTKDYNIWYMVYSTILNCIVSCSYDNPPQIQHLN